MRSRAEMAASDFESSDSLMIDSEDLPPPSAFVPPVPPPAGSSASAATATRVHSLHARSAAHARGM
jgi:hypothetical protein